jgi:hypothetical protein
MARCGGCADLIQIARCDYSAEGAAICRRCSVESQQTSSILGAVLSLLRLAAGLRRSARCPRCPG